GVNTWGSPVGENLGFAIASRHLQELFETAGEDYMPLASLPAVRDHKLPATPDGGRAEPSPPPPASLTVASEEGLSRALREIDRQAELNRLNEKIATLRKELAVIEVEGATLTAERGEIMSKGATAYARGSQIASRIAAARVRVAAIDGAVQNRELAIAGAPAFNDGESAPFTAAGIESLMQERLLIIALVNSLVREGQQIEALYAGFDLRARNLLSQLRYKERQRSILRAELRELLAEYEALAASAD
ncbi:MAG: hypothetical protein KY475_26390, partial [Planctomycetes bacterium]|nr:hypothetical protein [Planctomycetota bacterium]